MKKLQIETLTRYIQGLVAGEKGSELLKKFQIHDASFTALEVMVALDKVIRQDVDMERLKIASNKLFNILYETLSVTEKPKYPVGSILAHLVQDNQGIKEQLADTRKYIKQINREITPGALAVLQEHFDRIQLFTEHYVVMQNIVFPEIERGIKEHRCLQLMWAFHDDISMNIQKTLEELQAEYFDLARFNVASSKVYFAINTILFREENVLFPIMFEMLDESSFPEMLHQLREFKLAFSDTSAIQPNSSLAGTLSAASGKTHIQLSTGILDVQQLELIFKNLPVDITFVDENDEVKYFSSPEHRIFPRTTGIIGRKVQNCHPHESVHVVNQIVEAFKKGEKSETSFWIKMGAKYVLIKYFALRDNAQAYRGVLEVSQEISEIQKIKGKDDSLIGRKYQKNPSMKTVVIYYSNNGSNRYLARKISENLTCDLEGIRPRIDLFFLYLMGISFGIKPLKSQIQDYEKVVLCGPICMGKLIPPLKSFLQKYKASIRQLDFVSCCGSSDAKKDEKFGHGFVFREVEKIMGDKCSHCRAFPIDLVLPEDKKEDGDLIMKTRLTDDNFTGPIRERLDGFVAQISAG